MNRRTLILAALVAVTGRSYLMAREPAPETAGPLPVGIVALGDSITKGVRSGVNAEQTFPARLESNLQQHDIPAQVTNVGIGGERTDQALERLERDVIARKPRVVLIMYGTNDSYADQGAQKSRLDVPQYRENLLLLVQRLRAANIQPLLMTPPRWAHDASPNGVGENPNVRLEPFVEACREVAAQHKVPFVDHYAHWSQAAQQGKNLNEWTTDGCHPNAAGHAEMAQLIKPVVRELITAAQ